MRKENSPFVTDKLMEIDLSLGRESLEVGGCRILARYAGIGVS
jgi:hypothetical protein